MGLKAGIVGLPNVGKSTLFKALTNNAVEIANYPFATIAPNTGIVEVNDNRLDKLVQIYQSKKRIAATFEFIDIAGLVKGASKGEGLGNQFLGNIRQVDAILHVVRCFDNPTIVHVEQNIDPIRDIETINLELMLADLASATKRLDSIAKKATATKDPRLLFEVSTIEKLIKYLDNNQMAKEGSFSVDELTYLKNDLQLLTIKPTIYIANIEANNASDIQNNPYYVKVKKYAESNNESAIWINASIEADISEMSAEEKSEFLNELGLNMSGLDNLVKKAYSLLGLRTFFTAGLSESRAWTFIDGSSAPECAGIIHSDFQKAFIRAEVFSYEDLIKYGSEANLKAAGRFRIEGKEYKLVDGDIVHFRVNV